MSLLKWLYPGLRVKRWLLLFMIGVVGLSLGIAYVMTHFYREQPFPEFVYYLTLQFLDRPIRGLLFIAVGVGMTGFALFQLSRSLLLPLLPAGRDDIVEYIYQKRQLQRGPKVVAIGGGTGLSTLLRGLKEHTGNLTAIVTVADDGGSSGRLRRGMGVLPPGDFRQCLVALADAEPLMTRLFQYRFGQGSGLDGHSFGNLFIAAMSDITGNFERALRESSRVLAVRGQILPSTLASLTLCAEFEDKALISGESEITKAHKPIKRLFLQPEHPPAYSEAIRAILEADLIVVGPGSLYTSILPNLLVEDIALAIKMSAALKVYVCNVATEEGETDGFGVHDHVQTVRDHVGDDLFDYVLANNNLRARLPAGERAVPVPPNGDALSYGRYQAVAEDVIDTSNPLHHDPRKLARCLMRLYFDRTKPHVNGGGTSISFLKEKMRLSNARPQPPPKA